MVSRSTILQKNFVVAGLTRMSLDLVLLIQSVGATWYPRYGYKTAFCSALLIFFIATPSRRSRRQMFFVRYWNIDELKRMWY